MEKIKESEKIIGVIVTYNRKELLVDNLNMQAIQSRPLDEIVIIDNGGTDNTLEFVKKNSFYKKIEYIYLEKNIGCSGAFSKGIEIAFSKGADWIYVMDDDGKPYDVDTIKILTDKVKQKGFSSSDLIIANSLVIIDKCFLSFKINETFEIDKIKHALKDNCIVDESKLWNGSLISKQLFYLIGGPNPIFGFKGEEVDFKNRAKKSGAYIFTVFSSKYYHPQIKEEGIKFLGKTKYFTSEPDWKYYYTCRNRIFMLLRDKKILRAVMYYIKFYYCAKRVSSKQKWNDTKKIIMMAKRDAIHKKMGLKEFN